MKHSDSKTNDDSLSKLLKEWRIDEELFPRFQENVWRGIERAETRPAPSLSVTEVLSEWLERLLPRPAMALAYASVMLVAGGIVGMTHGKQESQRLSAELGQRYVQSVDPYQTNP